MSDGDEQGTRGRQVAALTRKLTKRGRSSETRTTGRPDDGRQRNMAAGERRSTEHHEDRDLWEEEKGKGFSKGDGKVASRLTKRNQTPHPHTRRRVDGGQERTWETTKPETSVSGDRAVLGFFGVVS
jgi:hypothetical protein